MTIQRGKSLASFVISIAQILFIGPSILHFKWWETNSMVEFRIEYAQLPNKSRF